ncbi:hypothetical protein QBC37DRAFT_298235 [Rhypophila decipiens]|uniref:Uncharacterized protein n=1 Tax=Rhypophila decipiens TaxID=261697 RepID=A0AAN6XW30_9PEZI|nr:hypothetical protein QBC37DRAFT_298235 [Rhypophila decipiens]
MATSFYQKCSEFKTRPFQHHQPLQGEAPRAWENFRQPKLWPCDFVKDWEWKALLGAGVDGFVSEVTILGKSYALKVFWNTMAPPEPEKYWAFQRECQNSALFEMITSAVHTASAQNEAVYLHPRPSTRDDAIQNLRAFSDGGRQDGQFQNLPVAVRVIGETMPRLRRCYGWTTVSPADIARAITRGLPRRLHASDVLRTISPETGDRNAIVYEYIPHRKSDPVVAQQEIDFLWQAGFQLTFPTRPEDWRDGVLLDLSAIRYPWHPAFLRSRLTRPKFKDLVAYAPNNRPLRSNQP